MLGLVRAPINLAVSVAKGGIGAGLAVARAAWGLVAGGDEHGGWDEARRHDPAASAAQPAPQAAAAQAAPSAPPAAPTRADPAAAEHPEPVHVSEEPVVVAEVAEAGAEDGAGPELQVEPPWEGYDDQDVRTIARRLRAADAAPVAAVELYEAANKQRRGVLEAAQRRLKQLSGPAGARNR